MIATSGEAIARLIEANTVEYFLRLGRLGDSEVYDTPELKYLLNNSWHNRVLRVQMEETVARQAIESLSTKIAARKSLVLWLVTPFSFPSSTPDLLAEHGFIRLTEWKSMAIRLTSASLSAITPAGLEIVPARDDHSLATWADVMVRSFEIDPEIAGPYARYFVDASTGQENGTDYYLGLLHGEPVATAALFYGETTAGIYWVGTLQEHRGKGIAQAMMAHVLRNARTAGYGLATLNASRMGYPLYRKLGFEEYFTTALYLLDKTE